MTMATEIKKEIGLEIAEVLFLDIVGYSKLSVNEPVRAGRGTERECSFVRAAGRHRTKLNFAP
jgi:hypothetical protein